MKKKLYFDMTGFTKNLVEVRVRRGNSIGLDDSDKEDGIHYIFRFENGFGASVVKHWGSYGWDNDEWEIAVIKFTSNEVEYDLDYDTDITCDVEGYLTDDDVRFYLEQIKSLDATGHNEGIRKAFEERFLKDDEE